VAAHWDDFFERFGEPIHHLLVKVAGIESNGAGDLLVARSRTAPLESSFRIDPLELGQLVEIWAELNPDVVRTAPQWSRQFLVSVWAMAAGAPFIFPLERGMLVHYEFGSVFAPEVRVVREDPASPGTFVHPPFITGYDPFDFTESGESPAPSVINKYYLEARLPLSEPPSTTGDLSALDVCRMVLPELSGRLAPTSLAGITLERITEDPRFALYRTPTAAPIVPVSARMGLGETAPHLPSGVTYFQILAGGFVDGLARADEDIRIPVDPAFGVDYNYPGDPDSHFYHHARVQPTPSLAMCEGDAYSLKRRISPDGAFEGVSFGLRRDPFALPPEITFSAAAFEPTANRENISFEATRSGGLAFLETQFKIGSALGVIPFNRSLDLLVFRPFPDGKTIRVAVLIVTDQASPDPHRADIVKEDVNELAKPFWSVPTNLWHPYCIAFSIKSVTNMTYAGDLGDAVDFVLSGARSELDDLWDARRPDGTHWRDDSASLNVFLIHSLKDETKARWGGIAPDGIPAYFVAVNGGTTYWRGEANAHELGHKMDIDGDYKEGDRGDELMSHGKGVAGSGVHPKISSADGLTARAGALGLAK